MQSQSAPEMLQIEASDALLSALVKLTAGTAVVVLSRDEAFELAAVRYLTARALHIAARRSEPAGV
jgi:hypothetical protein